jgi:hypothetical protein
VTTTKNEANPYTAPNASTATSSEAAGGKHIGLTDSDLTDLRLGARRSKERSARFEPYIWPWLALLVALYQFGMCWKVSQNSGVSFAELLSHDGRGFPAATYDGGLVRMFDRFVTGFCVLVAGGFMYFITRAGRKRDLQNARIHDAMLKAGLVSPDPKSIDS